MAGRSRILFKTYLAHHQPPNLAGFRGFVRPGTAKIAPRGI